MGVSKGLYLGSIIGGYVLGSILIGVWPIGVGPIAMEVAYWLESSPALGIGIALLIYAVVMIFVLLYKAWKVIQDGHARTSPGKAVGFLFIPFFQLYWFFQAYWGFARDYNAYVQRHYAVSESRTSIPKVSTGLFLAYCILYLVSVLLSLISGMIQTYHELHPFFGYYDFERNMTTISGNISLAVFVLLILVINTLCNAINNLPAYPGITSGGERGLSSASGNVV